MANQTFQPADEVRRCANCGQPALSAVHVWQHKVAGVYTQTQTRELQCRACGIKVVLHPETRIRAERLLAWLMLPAIVPSLIFFASARRKARAWTDNPVVDGASGPTAIMATGPVRPGEDEDRAQPETPDRRCECSAPARCIAIVREGTWNTPIGMRYEYQCPVCAKGFSVHSVTGIVFATVLASAISAAGALLIVHPPGAAVGAEQSNRWFGVGLTVLGGFAWLVFGWRVRGRLKHPIVSPG